MQNFSKYFNLDTIDTNQTLKPIIVITDSDNNVLFTLAQDQDEVFNNNGDSIDIINAINKVSNVKISNDFDTKKLKINRLRCTLYNYYNVNTKLSEYVNTGIINKSVYLFYKSPTTNIINFSDTQGDYDCALIYTGEISRVKFDDAKIDITAEDKTQIKIADKQVPYMSVDRLPLEIRERIIKEHREEDGVVPMTFGKVDKAHTLPYLEQNNEKVMNILLDNQPTSSNYKTSKIPKLLDSPTPTDNNYCLYMKKDDDYIIIDHHINSTYEHHNMKSKIKLYTFNAGVNNYLVPELMLPSELSESNLKLWSSTGYYQRLVDSVYASDGSILDIKNIEVGDLTDIEFENINSINDNGGFEKTWYRTEDDIESTINNFDTNLKGYPTTTTGGEGRWILLKLSDGINNRLYNIENNDVNIGNTFLCSDWKMYQEITEDGTPNDSSLASGIDRTGFFVAPISFDIWRNLINFSLINVSPQEARQANLNLMLLENDDNISEAEASIEISDQGVISYSNDWLQNAFATTNNTYYWTPIHINRGNVIDGGSSYWGIKGLNNGLNIGQSFVNIQGLYYGEDGSARRITHPTDEHDMIAIFEYFPPFWEGVNSYQQGLKMNNIGFLHSVMIDDLQEEKIYASIVGRTNKYYTQELEYIPQTETPMSEISLQEILTGPDTSIPNVLVLLDAFVDITRGTLDDIKSFDQQLPSDAPSWMEGFPLDTYFSASSSGSEGGFRLYNLESHSGLPYENGNEYFVNAEQIFQDRFNLGENRIDDSVMWNLYDLWKNYIWRVVASPMAMLDIVNAYTGDTLANLNDWYDQHGDNYYRYWNTDLLEAYCVKIFEYIYQTDIESTSRFEFYFEQGAINGGSFDITDAIETKMVGNNWNDYDIETLDDWINNFYVYFDNLIYAVQKSTAEALSTICVSDNIQNLEFLADYDSFINEYPMLSGISYLENSVLSLDYLREQIETYVLQQEFGFDVEDFLIGGEIEKPSDIVMNILVNEMEYGKLLNEQSAGTDIIVPDYSKFDMDSINESRLLHNWKMGFSIGKKTDGKKLIEEVLKESKSYPRFTGDGRFGLITIKESYTYDDIDMIIDTNDIIKYNFNQTKREDVITSVKMFYRYDYGLKKYNNYLEKKITEILPEYEGLYGYEYYNIDKTNIDSHKDINLKYHTDNNTVNDFAKYTLLNNCNVHNEINMALPLNYSELEVGDILYIPLINNTKAFDIDYSVVDYLNGQPVYPLWIIMSTDLGVNDIKINAVQLHYLGTDGVHGFLFPEQEGYDIIGNMKQFNSNHTLSNGEPLPNWNYNPAANIDSGFEIPYFDINGDGIINVVDIVAVINHILGTSELTQTQQQRLQYNSSGGEIDIIDVVSMVNMIL